MVESDNNCISKSRIAHKYACHRMRNDRNALGGEINKLLSNINVPQASTDNFEHEKITIISAGALFRHSEKK